MSDEIKTATLKYLCPILFLKNGNPFLVLPVFQNGNELMTAFEQKQGVIEKFVPFTIPIGTELLAVPAEKMQDYRLGDRSVHGFAFPDGNIKIGSKLEILAAIRTRVRELAEAPGFRELIAKQIVEEVLPDFETPEGYAFLQKLAEKSRTS